MILALYSTLVDPSAYTLPPPYCVLGIIEVGWGVKNLLAKKSFLVVTKKHTQAVNFEFILFFRTFWHARPNDHQLLLCHAYG